MRHSKLAGILTMLTTIACAQPDRLTTEGKSLFTQENVGPQIKICTVMSAALGPVNGKLHAFGVIMGEPGVLATVDAATGKLVNTVDMVDAGGSYDILPHSSGKLYLASHSKGFFYRYDPTTQKIENLGRGNESTSFIWDLCEGDNGLIYGACYPKSIVFEFDPKTDKFRDLGPAKKGEDYARCIVWSKEKKRLYVGIASHADLLELDPVSGERRSILPEAYRDQHFVYTLALSGKHLVARLDPSNKALVFDIETGKMESEIPLLDSGAISDVGPKGTIMYYTAGGELRGYDTATKTVMATGAKLPSAARAFYWQKDPYKLFMLGTGPKLLEYNPDDATSRTLDPEFPAQPIKLHNIALGPDGKMYTSGYVAGYLGVFDPVSGEQKQIGGIRQAEGITALGSKLYFGTYPRAIISVFDTAQPAGRGNPKELFRLEKQDQDRPFGMCAVPERKEVYVGTVPGYGLLGGVLATYNVETEKLDVLKDFIPKHSIVSLIHRDGILYGGSTVSGGLGIEPAEKEGKLFLFDVNKSEKILETVPVAGKKGVTGLIFGPEDTLWGWAEDTAFVFSLKDRKVTRSEKKVTPEEEQRHFWRGSRMTGPVDGVFYGCAYGEVYSLNASTREYKVLAKGQLELIEQDNAGNIYTLDGSTLLRLKPKK